MKAKGRISPLVNDRLRNASWRLWYQHRHGLKSPPSAPDSTPDSAPDIAALSQLSLKLQAAYQHPLLHSQHILQRASASCSMLSELPRLDTRLSGDDDDTVVLDGGSPERDRKKSRRVTFNEELNQTTYVSYEELDLFPRRRSVDDASLAERALLAKKRALKREAEASENDADADADDELGSPDDVIDAISDDVAFDETDVSFDAFPAKPPVITPSPALLSTVRALSLEADAAAADEEEDDAAGDDGGEDDAANVIARLVQGLLVAFWVYKPAGVKDRCLFWMLMPLAAVLSFVLDVYMAARWASAMKFMTISP